jgi:hypothetical protein
LWSAGGASSGKPGEELDQQNNIKMILRKSSPMRLLFLIAALGFITRASASYGDRLPEFRHCVEVYLPPLFQNTSSQDQICEQENCAYDKTTTIRTPLSIS